MPGGRPPGVFYPGRRRDMLSKSGSGVERGKIHRRMGETHSIMTGHAEIIPTELIIEARGLTRLYPMEACVVVGIREVDLEVRAGELVVLKGNSGSGKSTLLALLGGMDRPTRGRLTVAGRDLCRASPSDLTHFRRHVVGMVFQSFNLLPTLTVLENVCLPALLGGTSSSTARSSAMELLEWLGLESRLHHLPGQLSGGEMQRTAIARALINDPPILLADEPTGDLDSANGLIVMKHLGELNRQRGRTILIATHSIIADPYATRTVHLEDGSIAEVS